MMPKLNSWRFKISIEQIESEPHRQCTRKYTIQKLQNILVDKLCKSDGYKWNMTMLVAGNLATQKLGSKRFYIHAKRSRLLLRLLEASLQLILFAPPSQKTTQVSANIMFYYKNLQPLGIRTCCCDRTVVWPFSSFAPKTPLKNK